MQSNLKILSVHFCLQIIKQVWFGLYLYKREEGIQLDRRVSDHYQHIPDFLCKPLHYSIVLLNENSLRMSFIVWLDRNKLKCIIAWTNEPLSKHKELHPSNQHLLLSTLKMIEIKVNFNVCMQITLSE